MSKFPFENNFKINKKIFQKSIYNTKNSYINEYVDKSLIEGFIKNVKGIDFTYQQQKKFFNNELEFMKSYFQLYNRKERRLITKLYFPKHKWGRIIATKSLSLSVMHRPTRHALAKDKYIDIDMKNASQNILNEIMKQNNIQVPHISNYCINRDKYLNFIQKHYNTTRDEAKKLIISLSFGGGYDKWIIDHKYNDIGKFQDIIDLEGDYTIVMENVWKSNNNIIDDILENNSTRFDEYKTELSILNAKKRTCMSLFYQTIERHIQEGMINFLVSKKDFVLEDIIPCQDGIMILKDLYYDDLISDVENEQLNKWGFIIPMMIKPFDEAIHIEPFINTMDTELISNDSDATDRVFKLYPNWVCCLDVLYVFDEETGLWCNDKISYFKVIKTLNEFLYTETANPKIISKISYGNTLCLMERIIVLIKTLCVNNDWLNQKSSSSLGKILFNNGYYDFKKCKFYDKFNPDIVFFGKIHHNFEHFTDEDMVYIKDIKQRLFYDTLGVNVGDYFIETLARGLAGEVQKRMLFALGATNTGKSILTKGLQLSLGDYVDGFNAENLAYRNSSADEAQQNRWAMLLRNKRIILSNEIKSNCELNGNSIKKISNGGSDILIGRGHSGNETGFTPHFLPVIFANDLPKITPYDDAVDTRVRVVSYVKQFVDEPSNEMELKKDDNIKAELETLNFQRCMVGLLILQHLEFTDNGALIEPDEVKQAKRDWIGEEVIGGFLTNFLNDFEITNDEDDYILSGNIDEWIKEGKYGISMKKFGMEMKKYLLLKKYDKVCNKVKRIDGKGKQVWIGLKNLNLVG